MSLLLRLISLLPFFAGPLLIRPPYLAGSEVLNTYIKLYFAFVSTFAFFSLAKFFLEKYSKLNSSDQPRHSGRLWITLVVAVSFSILTLVSLATFRDKFEQLGFFLLLMAISATTFGQMLYYRRLVFAALLAWGAYAFLVCLIGFYVEAGAIHWQSVLFSLSLASMIGAVWTAMELSNRPLLTIPAPSKKQKMRVATERTSTSKLRLLHAIFLVSTPLYIGLLFYSGQLSKPFLAVFIIIPLSARLLPREGFDSDDETLPRYFLAQTTGTCILFVGIIAALRFLSPS